jgi:hypothetical protein
LLGRIGPQETVQRFISRYGKQSTKTAYLARLDQYLRWLKAEKEGYPADTRRIDQG